MNMRSCRNYCYGGSLYNPEGVFSYFKRPSSLILLNDLKSRISHKNMDGELPTSDRTKTPSESYTSLSLPLSTDKELFEQYRGSFGILRFGLILEDLDMICGHLGYIHCDDSLESTRPVLIVTASVQRILLLNPLKIDQDLHFYGKIVYTGRSSMLCLVELSQNDPISKNVRPLLHAYFTMVALDSKDKIPVVVPKIRPQTELDRLHYQKGAEMVRSSKEARDVNLKKVPPTPHELQLIHQFFISPPKESIEMSETQQQSIQLCHPQDRNLHNKIFGGFLMRKAFELGWATGYSTMRSRPFFLNVDDIQFIQPVEIGSLLKLESCIVYVNNSNSNPSSSSSSSSGSRRSCVIRVSAYVCDPTAQKTTNSSGDHPGKVLTNTFHFTFTFPDLSTELPIVRPTTYSEAMMYIEGKRIFDSSFKAAERDDSSLLQYY